MKMNMKINGAHLDAAEKILVSRARELAERAGYSAAVSDFLSPREQIIFYQSAASAGAGANCFFWGGCLGAERRCALILPDWMLTDAPSVTSIFDDANETFIAGIIENGIDSGEIGENIIPIKLTGSTYSTLTHRDWLGSILGLGIRRDVIGDIIVYSDSEATVFASAKIAEFITDSLTHVKDDTVSATADTSGAILESLRSFRHYETIVQSMRLDCVVKSLTNLSRADAAELVRAGKVDVNYFTETNVDAEIGGEDVLSIHGFGKYIVDRAEDHTKSGRIKLKSRKYI